MLLVQGRWYAPLGLQCAVKPFDLAVGPRAVRLDEDVPDTAVGEQLLRAGAVPVGEGVGGHHALNDDAVADEEHQPPGQEPGAGQACSSSWI